MEIAWLSKNAKEAFVGFGWKRRKLPSQDRSPRAKSLRTIGSEIYAKRCTMNH